MAEAIADPRRREVRQGLISTTLTGRRFFTSIDGLVACPLVRAKSCAGAITKLT